MIDQDTQTNETENSAAQTTTSEQSQAEDTSTTTSPPEQQQTDDQERVDLGTGKDQTEDEEPAEQEQEDTRTDEEKAADEERAKLFGAPEGDAPYEVSGLPEGMEVDTTAVEALTPLARQLDLSNEGFKALAHVYATEVLPGVTKTIVDGINADVLETRKGWETEARDLIAGKGDQFKNVAGEPITFDGKSLSEVQKMAAKSLDRFAPDGFRTWLDETGLGVHPQMIAFAYNVGKAHAEDSDVEPAETGSKDQRATAAVRRKAGGMDPAKFFDR
jgi:hypothetical protein